jgi:plastocyanin
VTSDKGIWSSGDVNSQRQFARTFAKAGTFPYHCSIHPFMHGTVTVRQ